MQNKLELIETEKYWLAVSDKQPVVGYYFDTNINRVHNTGGSGYGIDNTVRQIVAHLSKDNNPILEGVDLLPEIMEVEDDVEKLALHYSVSIAYKGMKDALSQGYLIAAFINGHKAATKTFSEADMREAIKIAIKLTFDGYRESDNSLQPKVEELIQSLKQLTKPKYFVADTTISLCKRNNTYGTRILKTTTNKQGLNVLVGKYE
jgi:hypothetical protein